VADPVSPGAALGRAIKTADITGTRVFQRGHLARFGERVTLPYITWDDPITGGTELEGDCEVIAEFRVLQVSLWQKAVDHSPELVRSLKAAIRAADLNSSANRSAQHIYGPPRISDEQRIDDPEPGIVHDAISVRLKCAP
jgi:hypothetical protein